MRILLKVPPTWYVEPLRSGLTHYRMPDAPAVRMLVSALVPLPGDISAWRVRELHALVPDECDLALAAEGKTFSALGWPMRVVDADCRRRDPSGGFSVVESWLAVFLEAGHLGAIALVRAARRPRARAPPRDPVHPGRGQARYRVPPVRRLGRPRRQGARIVSLAACSRR
jgi:hypothetical protein